MEGLESRGCGYVVATVFCSAKHHPLCLRRSFIRFARKTKQRELERAKLKLMIISNRPWLWYKPTNDLPGFMHYGVITLYH